MRIHDAESSADFADELRGWLLDVRRSGLPGSSPRVYFRGVCDSSYELLSTLERSGLVGMLSLEYYRGILDMKPEIEQISGRAWNVPGLHDYQSSYSQGSPFMLRRRCYSPAVFDYMAWLRHYGFVSPLLDWTRSLDVAMFFAFRDANPRAGAGGSDTVAVYGVAYDHDTRYEAFGEPSVFVVDREARGNNRYAAQHAACSVSVVGAREDDNVVWRYCRHGEGLDGSGQQDALVKFCVPASERNSVLASLDRAGVNESSSFGSAVDNSLRASAVERIETMAREFNSQISSIHATRGVTMSAGEKIHVTGVTDATRVAGS